MISTKPFKVSKRLVWEAWKRVKANGGSHGIDSISLEEFEEKLSNNLYKIWNRLSSGSYHPPPVRRVEIPKGQEGKRVLGIPTVGDRVAQMVVKLVLEPKLEPVFHADSYGYRPGKSALDALGTARERCWKYSWVVDVDIKGFFDNLSHELLMKAVDKHTDCPWIKLYLKRWLKAPLALSKVKQQAREKGTPQGGVISPLLANLYLHYAFDVWMSRNYKDNPFERYADDIVIHCRNQWGAERLLYTLKQRLKECHLELHAQKSKIVYCKSSSRKGDYTSVSFDFLGYCFKPRKTMSKAKRVFTGFGPAISGKSLKRINGTIRKWKVQRWTGHEISEIAKALNPIIAGWLNYYKHFGKSELYNVKDRLDFALIRWARKKYKKLSRSYRKSKQYLARVRKQQPMLFSHWRLS